MAGRDGGGPPDQKVRVMSRSDVHFDAMLRHLGAAYYQTIHGDGTASDVARALESAEAADGRERESQRRAHRPHRGRWRVRDVMTTDVLTVPGDMPYKQVARVMTGRRVSGVPVVTKEGHVTGMVSEADILRKEERAFRRLGTGLPRRTRRERAQARARCAAELMTSPAITIHPDAPVGAAARLMNGHRIRRLPVVDPSGKLIGMVSRRDLLSVFLRPDEEIAAEVYGMLTGILLAEPDGVQVTVRDGVVFLSCSLPRPSLIPVAERLASGVDGVVAVVGTLTIRADSGTASALT
jgi:CBS domain-containing protein